jgi:hypothetical protein
MSLMELEFLERDSNPVDMIEVVAAVNEWSFERSGEDEIAMTVEGKWADYHISFSWMEEFEALHLACAFDMKVPASRILEVVRLLSHVNAQVLMGHFDLWEQEDVVIFRQSLLLSGGARADEPAGRSSPLQRAGDVRNLFPGLPVRRLVGHGSQERGRDRPVRDRRGSLIR